jgi:ubiquinone/menaquinone biosynthesis C-methylase UbiE
MHERISRTARREEKAMDDLVADKVFAGAIPELYERYLVPMIFAPYAADMARRAAALQPARVLEVAAGTGALTRELAQQLPAEASIVATDLNPPMLKRAQAVGTSRPVTWQTSDAMQLPFDDGSFDLVVCQFGVMFFPDKPKAFAEALRVLGPGGALLFNVWDRIEENDFAHTTSQALARLFPDSPPEFMARTPHGYHRQAEIAEHLRQGGFRSTPAFETVPATSRAESARIPAVAFCQGTPMRAELESRAVDALQRATDCCELALAQAFGTGPIEGRIQARVVMIEA